MFILDENSIVYNHASINPIAVRGKSTPKYLWNFEAKNIIVNFHKKLDVGLYCELYLIKKSRHILFIDIDGRKVKFSTCLPSKKYELRLLASWKSLQHGEVNLFPNRFIDFENSVVRVATFDRPPAVMYIYDANGNIVKRLGIEMNLMSVLQKFFNFKVEYLEVKKNEMWGYELANGTWVGMIGALAYDSADVGAGNFFVEINRYDFVSYTSPFKSEQGCFATPAPTRLPRWTSPILPFTMETWVSFAVAYFVGILVLKFISGMSYCAESSNYSSWSYDMLYMVACFTVRSPSRAPTHSPTRIYVATFWAFAITMSTAYAANLIAVLTTVQKTPPITTFKELRDSGLTIWGSPFWRTQFAPSTDEDVRSFGPRLQHTYSMEDIDNVFKEIEKGKYAFIDNNNFLDLYIKGKYTYGNVPTIRIVDQCLVPFSIALGVQKHSPLAEPFSGVILRMVEAGLTNKWAKEVNDEFRARNRNRQTSRTVAEETVVPLTIDHLLGIFMVICVGWLVALLVFVAEIFVCKFKLTETAF